ncbi:MAG: glycosyltransferase family 4 protein [Ginsengibacter sp.]
MESTIEIINDKRSADSSIELVKIDFQSKSSDKIIRTRKKLIRITTIPLSLKVLLKQQLKFMSAHYDVLAVASPEKMLDEVAASEGVRTAAVLMTRTISPVKDIKALWQLYRLFKKEQPSIIHTHTPKAGLLGMIAAKMAGVSIRMHTVAGLPLMETKGIKKRMLEWVERLTYTCATKVYPNSKNLAEYILQNKYCASKKLKVLGNGSSNGIDTDFFQLNPNILFAANNLRERLQVKKDDFVFVFIGRLVKDKGMEELVDAFSRLKKTHRNSKLLLVGHYEPELDPLSNDTVQLIQEDNDIMQVGFQADIRPYLAISDVLTFPSYREGFPNVPMQAACMNIPSIVTDINGCNEIIEDGKNGLIIPPKNSEALYQAMEALITNRSLYDALKANARRLIVEKYDQNHFWNLLLKEYEEQLANESLS